MFLVIVPEIISSGLVPLSFVSYNLVTVAKNLFLAKFTSFRVKLLERFYFCLLGSRQEVTGRKRANIFNANFISNIL